MRDRPLLALVGVIACMVTGCTSGDDDTTASTTTAQAAPTTIAARSNVDGVLQIATWLPRTGDAALLGPGMERAVALAARDINAAGGVLRNPVRVTGFDETLGSVSLEDLIDESSTADAIVGPASSTTALRSLDQLVGSGLAVCSPAATAMALADFPDNGAFIRTIPSDRLLAQAMAELIGDRGGASAAILTSDDSYGRSLAKALAADLERDGLLVTATTAYPLDGSDVTEAVREVVDTRPEAVAVIGFPDTGAPVLAKLIDLGRGPAILDTFVSDGLRAARLYERIDPTDPSITFGIRGVSPAVTPVRAERWINDSFHLFAPDASTAYAAYAYDCAIVLALAAQVAGTDDPMQMTRELVNVTRGGVPCTTFAECKQLLESGRNIDYDGVSGLLDLDDNGDPTVGAYEAFHFDPIGFDVSDGEQ